MTYTVLSNKIEVLEPDAEGFIAIQVREKRLCTEADGEHEAGQIYYHRIVHMPDHDASGDSPTVRATCEAIHDAEWKDKYQAKLDAEAAAAEAERLEQERIAAEAEAEAQRLADEAAAARQAEIDAAVAKALEAQQAS